MPVSLEVEHLPPWQRVLWRQQPYPDNYTPPTFLSALRTPAPPQLGLGSLMLAALPLGTQLNLVAIFVAVFLRLQARVWYPPLVSLFIGLLTTLGWAACEALQPARMEPSVRPGTAVRKSKRGQTVLSFMLLCLVLYALSPLMRTMTASTTSDSIWGLAGGLFALHLAAAEYRLPGPDVVPVRPRRHRGTAPPPDAQAKYIVAGSRGEGDGALPSPVSLSAAMCGSVVLASRLQSEAGVFALLLTSLSLFALVPAGRARLTRSLARRAGAGAAAGVSGALFGLTLVAAGVLYGCAYDARAAAALHVALALHGVLLVLATGAGPLWLHRAQARRRSLAGAWDPAVPIVRARGRG